MPMIPRRPHEQPPAEMLQVVLDDATVTRLRRAAALRNMEVEQLIVSLLHSSSYAVDKVLLADAPDLDLP